MVSDAIDGSDGAEVRVPNDSGTPVDDRTPRDMTDDEREAFKAECLAEFWGQVATLLMKLP